MRRYMMASSLSVGVTLFDRSTNAPIGAITALARDNESTGVRLSDGRKFAMDNRAVVVVDPSTPGSWTRYDS